MRGNARQGAARRGKARQCAAMRGKARQGAAMRTGAARGSYLRSIWVTQPPSPEAAASAIIAAIAAFASASSRAEGGTDINIDAVASPTKKAKTITARQSSPSSRSPPHGPHGRGR